MVFDIDFMYAFEVLDSWETVRRIDGYEDKLGKLVFQKLFERRPEIKSLFGFKIDTDPSSPDVQKSPRFTTHARFLVQMLDRTLNVVGPDVELLAEILQTAAKKHIRFGLEVEHFACMTDVIMDSLADILGDRFTSTWREAWQTVLDAIRNEMVKTMQVEGAVFVTWHKVKAVKNYREVVGPMLFQNMFRRCPESKLAFGIPEFADPESASVLASPAFRIHSVQFVDMLDGALTMMESKQLSEEMGRLGAKHAKMGITKDMFDSLGEALLETLGDLLPDTEWTEATQEAWLLTYSKLSTQMIKSMKQ